MVRGRTPRGIDRHWTLLGLGVLGVVGLLAYIAFVSTTGPPLQKRYRLDVRVPADAPTLRRGQAVRVGGKLAGLVSEVEPDRRGGGSVVTANITKPGFRPLPQDTKAYVRVHSLVYETYLELRPGDSGEKLADRATLTQQATSGVDLLEVVQLFDKRTRGWLSDTTINLGYGVAGRGRSINEMLADLPGLSGRLRRQFDALTREPGALERTLAGTAGTARGLRGQRADDVSGFITASDDAFAVTARRETELRAGLRALPGFAAQLRTTAAVAKPLLNSATELGPELRPAVSALNARLPKLNRLLDRGDAVRKDGGAIADAADPVLTAARPVIVGLFPTMTSLQPLNQDLDELLDATTPYRSEIAQAGQWFADSTRHNSPNGIAAGAAVARFLPVLTEYPCRNPVPKPGEAQKDSCR